MKALVLAAGLGTRLRPLTLFRAKPSLPVVGVPTLWYGAWHLKEALGIKDFAINLGHAAESLRQAGDDSLLQKKTGISFYYSDESAQILGSSGVLAKLAGWIAKGTLAVCNGDSICFPSWKKMLEFHSSKKSKLTLHIRKFSNNSESYTNIETDSDGRVLALKARTVSGVMFSGSYLIEPSLLPRLPSSGPSELGPILLEPLIRERELFAFREDIEWFDTGTIAAFAEVQFALARQIPYARKLIELKMCEVEKECWIPREWAKKGGIKSLKGPVVLTGEQEKWAKLSQSFGPRFVGIEPPDQGLKIPNSNALVFSEHIENL